MPATLQCPLTRLEVMLVEKALTSRPLYWEVWREDGAYLFLHRRVTCWSNIYRTAFPTYEEAWRAFIQLPEMKRHWLQEGF